MSCFVIPLLQAAATSACRRHFEKHPSEKPSVWKSQLPTLEKMLWGGSIVLVVDHIASGELSWAFPFFTALGQQGGFGTMLWEMLTVGVPMSLAVTALWALTVLVKTRRRSLFFK